MKKSMGSLRHGGAGGRGRGVIMGVLSLRRCEMSK